MPTFSGLAMTDMHISQSRSDQSDRSDPFGILALFRSDMGPHVSDQSDRPATPIPAGPTGPTASNLCRAGKDKQKQCGPTGPTGPTAIRPHSAGAYSPNSDVLDFFDPYEEREAIRNYYGGQLCAEIEAAALAEAANRAGSTTNILRQLWAKHPDAKGYLAHLSVIGLMACSTLACALRWDRTRARQAKARLRASGLMTLDKRGRAKVRNRKDQK